MVLRMLKRSETTAQIQKQALLITRVLTCFLICEKGTFLPPCGSVLTLFSFFLFFSFFKKTTVDLRCCAISAVLLSWLYLLLLLFLPTGPSPKRSPRGDFGTRTVGGRGCWPSRIGREVISFVATAAQGSNHGHGCTHLPFHLANKFPGVAAQTTHVKTLTGSIKVA